jgi:hypothetical protein
MSVFRKLFAVIGFAFLISCNNNSTVSNDAEAQDSTETEIDETALAQQQIAAAFPAVYQFFAKQDSLFAPQKFVETEADTVQATTALPNTQELKAFYPYFIYNTDSSYAIDLYSYNILLVNKNGTTIGEAGGPDTEVGLVDLKNNTRRRVYFGGSSSAVLDANWINNNSFLLMTGEIVKDDAFSPTILKYTLPDHSVQRFIYDDTLSVRPSEYQDKRLPIR